MPKRVWWLVVLTIATLACVAHATRYVPISQAFQGEETPWVALWDRWLHRVCVEAIRPEKKSARVCF